MRKASIINLGVNSFGGYGGLRGGRQGWQRFSEWHWGAEEVALCHCALCHVESSGHEGDLNKR